MGQGEDILITLQYYGLFDPLAMLSAFVPQTYTEYLYIVLVIVRVYLSGLFFLCFCLYMKHGGMGALLGSLAYALCGFSLYAGVRHPFFLTPVVFFPLLVLGSEKILRKENPGIFIFSLFLTTISNFYFAYMECLLLIVYVVIRYFSIPGIRHCRELSSYLIRFLIAGITGLAMAALVFLPVVYCFLNNARAGVGNAVPLLYPRVFYEECLIEFMGINGTEFWTYLGFTPLCFLSIGLLFSIRKKNTWVKWLFAVTLAMQCFPVFGHVINGFSYVSNRWSWVFSFIAAYILALMWPEINRLSAKKKRWLCFFTAGYLLIVFLLPQTKGKGSITQWILLCVSLALICMDDRILFFRGRSIRKAGLSAVCIFSIIAMGYSLFAVEGNGYILEFLKRKEEKNSIEQSAGNLASPYMENEMFTRYTQQGRGYNHSILNRTYGVASYWSLHANYITQYRQEMELAYHQGYKWCDYDHRAYLDALNNIGYRVCSRSIEEDIHAGYGFDQELETDQFILYKNQYPMPIGYTYDSVLTHEKYELLTAEQKQEALLQNILLHGETRRDYDSDTCSTSSGEAEYSMEVVSGNCEIGNHEIIVKQAPATVRLLFDPQSDCELYLNLKNLQVEPIGWMDAVEKYDDVREVFELLSDEEKDQIRRSERLSMGDTTVKLGVFDGFMNRQIDHFLSNDQFYLGIHDYLINMGYMEEERSFFTITFDKAGVYMYDDMRVVCQAMDDLPIYISERSEESIGQIEFGVNSMKGGIEVSEHKILCMAAPYSTGWKAYVDGQETPILRANIWSMAIELEPGKHEVEFRYMTPWIKMSAYISLLGWACFAAVEIGYQKKKWYVK